MPVVILLAGLGGCDGDSDSDSDNDGAVVSYGLVVADINQDARPDIVTANTDFSGPPNTGSVKVILQDAVADFGEFVEQGVFYEMGADTFDVAVADVNVDGRLDVLSTSRSEGELSYRLQLDAGDGSLGEELLLDTSSRPGAIVVADINGDAFDDIIVSGTSIVFWLYDRMDFDDPDDDEYRLGGTLNVRGQALAVANLNEDTQLDIIVGTPTGELSVFLQAPGSSDFFNPVFLPATDYDVDGEVFDIEIADLDRDGRLDIAAVTSRSIAVLLQQLAPLGSGEFRDAVTYPIRGNGRQLVIDNIDGDNLLDLAATNYLASGGGISIWLQDDGVVGADFVPGPYIRATSPWGLGVADFNRDNLLDFAFANVNGASIVLQDWRNPGEFLPPDPDTNPVGGDNNPED